MKLILNLAVLLIIVQSCNSTKSYSDSSESIAVKQDSQNELSFTYTAISRGSYQYINITKDSIHLSNDRYLKDIYSFKCNKADWQSLINLKDKLKGITLSELKAPTDKRLYDGAPIAVLNIKENEKEQSTSGFDHGFPPGEIETLVNKMIAVKEALEKE